MSTGRKAVSLWCSRDKRKDLERQRPGGANNGAAMGTSPLLVKHLLGDKSA
jgi:hypothetical protein